MYITIDDILTFITQADLDALVEKTVAGWETRLDKAIQRAQSRMNFYLGKRVAVPLAPENVNDDLKGICVDITIYFLHSKTQSDRVPEWVNKKYEDAISTLKDISKGIGDLQFASDPLPEQDTSITTIGDEPVMTRDMM
jgi:phage gp36-like protein